jgi:hypothetical protein
MEEDMGWLSKLFFLKWIKEKWKDPVWSKVFATGIIFLIVNAYLLIASVYESIPVKDSYENTINFLLDTKYQVNLFTIVICVLIFVVFLMPRIISMIRNYRRPPFSQTRTGDAPQIIDVNSTDIPITNGLVIHLDASDISSLFQTIDRNEPVAAENQPVGLWKDKSGNNNHLYQVIPECRPRFVIKGIGNKSSVEFDTGKSLFTTTNFPPPVTVIYVARQMGSWNRRVLSAMKNNWLLGYWEGAKNQAYYEGWVSPKGSPSTDDLCHVFSGIVRGPGLNSEVWADGSVVAANHDGVAGPNGLAINTSQYPDERSDCQVAEIIVFNRAISETERLQVEAYTKAKWGIKC